MLVFVAGLDEQSFPALSGGLLSGDDHILKPSPVRLPSAAADLKTGTILPLSEGVFPSVLACMDHVHVCMCP